VLTLIATPIGNLADISLRALEEMKKCDKLLCEDTRRSAILLNHYDIKKPLESYHQYNEAHKLSKILSSLKQGLHIGLLSDGGTPGLCDPGLPLVRACIAEGIAVTAVSGPCALILALILSGFPTEPFQFFGFMPRKEAEILSLLPFVLSFPGTSIFYESPKRLEASLSLLAKMSPHTEVAVARELTKAFETVVRMTAKEAFIHFAAHPPRGEIVLLIKQSQNPFAEKEPKELVSELVTTYSFTLPEAIKTASHLLKVPKQSVYKLFHAQENSTQ
jgi:16S rRNA (cytidine1402-2'-O)-methyltransferase